MTRTNELIDAYKKSLDLQSDYAAAKALGLRPNRISNYRCGVSHADDKTAVILADALGLDRLKTIAEINSDRANTARDRTFWKNVAKAASVALFFSLGTPSPADASTLNNSQAMHYANLMVHRIIRLRKALTRARASWHAIRNKDNAASPVLA